MCIARCTCTHLQRSKVTNNDMDGLGSEELQVADCYDCFKFTSQIQPSVHVRAKENKRQKAMQTHTGNQHARDFRVNKSLSWDIQ